LPFVALASAVLAAPAVGGANPSRHVASLRAHDAQIVARSRAAVLGLYAIDHRLAVADVHLKSLRHRSESLQEERRILELQIRIARHSSAVAERALAQRLRTLYEDGDVEPIEILFGSKSLDDAMTNVENLSRMSQEGADDLADLKAAKEQLAAAAHGLAKREAALAAAMRAAKATAAALARARVQRAAYISSLSAKHRMTRRAIAAVVARAREAQARSTAVVPVSAPASEAASSPSEKEVVPAGHTLTVLATGYALGGTTSTGLPVGWGVAAVDPSVIPLGTHMTVPGYGEAVAADVGGAVHGAVVDLWFPSPGQANAWGRRSVTIALH
jgi:3D (Asp-Asp-Asp) domain-containing protein